jgi:serine/threonine protein kinase
MSEQPTVRVGEYEIVSVLDHGGMASVFKVRHLISDRIEAMKVLLPDLAGRQELAERFRREIKILASLDHPSIAALRTALSWENRLVMIMEYVEGITLEARIARGALPVHEAVTYTRQVLFALTYAHGRHIIHRDIKPSNIMLTQSGSIKLMDFGIARCGGDRTLTSTGTTLGSLYYMSPEQVKGEPADERSDLYSLGVTLYEMVTARKPFEAENNYSIMAAHVREQPKPPTTVRLDLPSGLNDIILRALAKHPSERFQSAYEFSEALKGFAAPLGTVESFSAETSTLPGFVNDAVTLEIPSPNSSIEKNTRRADSNPSRAETNLSAHHQSLSSLGLSNWPKIPDITASASTRPEPSIQVEEQNHLGSATSKTPPGSRRRPAVDRGLYMGLGAGVVLLILIVAAIVFPRANRTQAGNAVRQAPPTPVKNAELGSPERSPTATPSSPAAGVPAQKAPITAQPLPAKPERENEGYKKTGVLARRDHSTDVGASPAPAAERKGKTSPASPGITQVEQPATTDSSLANPAQEPKPVTIDPARLARLSQDLDLLSSRAESIAQSLKTLSGAQRAQGLGLRGDIVSAEERMHRFLSRAESALNAQDAEQAKKYLDLAETEANALEKFLGR